MATKVAAPAVSYGIGVQNRYSAFLDDEDASNLGLSASIRKQPQAQANHQPQSLKSTKVGPAGAITGQSKLTNSSATSKSGGRSTQPVAARKLDPIVGRTTVETPPARRVNQELASKQIQQVRPHQQRSSQQQRGQPNGNNATRQYQYRNHANQENSANNQKFNRGFSPNAGTGNLHSQHQHPNQATQSHDSIIGQQEQTALQSSSQGKFGRPSGTHYHAANRAPNRRNFSNNDEKRYETNNDEGYTATIVAPSLEEEKLRRQQKRSIDLKHKDPEKREARRQQAASATVNQDRSTEESGEEPASAEPDSFHKNQRARRQVGDRHFDQDDSHRGPRNSTGFASRGRYRRDFEPDSERKDLDGDVGRYPPRRGKNSYGINSRGGRMPRNDAQGKFDRETDRQKPIPNFSDKLDFPSLAS